VKGNLEKVGFVRPEKAMSKSSTGRERVEELAEEFAERYRRGECPSIEEYVAAHPEHAGEIRDLFPALVLMEELAPGHDDSETAHGPMRPDAEIPAPSRIGDYLILREIGRGGMGVVSQARPRHASSTPPCRATWRRSV
jgi:hypothetical protein